MLLMHLFVYFVRVSFCHFSLPLGVGGWLRFVIVALPGLFYQRLYYRAFHVESCLALFSRVLVLFSFVITSLGEERAVLCASRAFVCLFCVIFSSFWCQGWAAACN